MARNTLFLRLGLWLFFELAILVLALVAAWRRRLAGLWVLALAFILMLLDDVLHMVWSQDFLVRHENTTVYLTILGYGYNGAIVAAVCGWGLLAFGRRSR